METYAILLTALGLWSLISAVWLVILLLSVRQLRKILSEREEHWRTKNDETNRSWLTQLSQLQSGPLALVDKAMGLVATTDPLAFQQVQVMTQPSGYDEPEYDPSDEAEVRRIQERERDLGTGRDDLNAIDTDVLDELGVSAEFFYANPTPE